MPRRNRIVASLAAGALGLTLGLAACGDSETGRENQERGNLGNTSQGPQTVETGPTTLGSTGEEQPDITQTQTTP
ncbi:MAG: hypothetical protein M3320_02925 [Actinomycetota bacterium]|nr:hypothetical protein [Actinomycetota bacterium]MDQ5807607.1 hypothetical protein [Actinomycetota bacterium]